MKKNLIKRISQTFLSGVLLILPIFISIYVLFWLAGGLDRLFNNVLSLFSSELYLPKGAGFILGAAIIYFIGLSTEFLVAQWIAETIEKFVKKIPVVGAIFEGLKNLADYLNPQRQQSRGQTVAVTFPESNFKVIGFMTRPNLKQFPQEMNDTDRVAVYVPMSYMVGGITLFVPRKNVEILDIPFEKAMPGALTGWVQMDKRDE